MDICETLYAVPYFRGLNEETICSVLEYSVVKNLAKGQSLFVAGETCEHLYIIEDGLIEIFRIGEEGKKIIMHHAGSGAFLGDTLLFNEGVYGANASALKASSLVAIEKKSFEKLIYAYPEIGIRMLADFGKRITKLQSFVAEIALHDVRKRIIKLLIELIGNPGISSLNTITLTDIPTQDEMAYRIGTVREVFCRGLHKLEKEQLIKVKRGEIVILDISRLKHLISEEDEDSLFPIALPVKKFEALSGAF